jgi:acyl carrier protein
LRHHVLEHLPDYMLPAHFVVLESFPLTPTGKIQRSALPPPSEGGKALHRMASNPIEDIIAGIWSDVLGRTDFTVDDNFFALGGHSLLATQVASRIEKSFGFAIALRQLFEAPTVAALAELISSTRHSPASAISRVDRLPGQTKFPLSFAQQRFWFLDQLTPGNPAYVIPATVRLRGLLHVSALEQSLNAIVQRHEALRTTFPTDIDGPVQQLLARPDVNLVVEDLNNIPAEHRAGAAERMAIDEAARPFDLQHDSPLRIRLLRLADDEHWLLLTIHHIASDGWSMGVLVSELASLYRAFTRGQPCPLPDLPLQYADFAQWQRQYLTGQVLEEHLAYWRSQLNGQAPPLRLADRKPGRFTGRGARLPFELSAEVTAGMKRIARQSQATLFMTMLAAFQALLYRMTGQSDVVIGTPIANRNRREMESLIGLFVNTLPLRGDLSGRPSFEEVLRRTRNVTLDAYTHQDLPFERLVKELAPQRDLHANPLFEIFFGMFDIPEPGFELDELELIHL